MIILMKSDGWTLDAVRFDHSFIYVILVLYFVFLYFRSFFNIFLVFLNDGRPASDVPHNPDVILELGRRQGRH